MRTLPALPALTSALLAVGLGAVAVLPVGADAATDTAPTRTPSSTSLPLPDGFQPEGIATAGKRVLVSSKATGDIYALNARTGKGRILAQGPGTPSLGLETDAKHHRLFVAGGTGGDARVLDLKSGRLIRSYRLTAATSFVNDQVITPRGVFFTDSAQSQLYRIPLGRQGRLPAQKRVDTVPLTGAWKQVAGETNANGIVRTPDGRALLVVNSTTGRLYRVAYDGRARAVRLGGVKVTDGDGLLLVGRSLYVVENQQNRIAVVRMSRDGRTGDVKRYLTSPRFDVPSTIAAGAGSLFLPNARFSTTPTPTTTYSVTRLR